ncbi:MAG: fibronectin type III domain-containing protein, partial [Proteobacteria bacterium]
MNTFNKLGPGHLTFFLVAASSQLWGCSGGKTSELARVKQLTDVKVAPNSPTALSLSHSHSGQAELTWTASSLGNSPISYQVLRSTSVSGPFSEVVSGLTATTYTDSNLINNVTYYYQIKATNSVGTSAATSPQSVVVDFKKQLDFDFTTLSIAPVSGSNSITFNRSGTQSAGTYHDSTGRIIRTSTNYFLHSNNFLHSAWDHVSATLTPNATTAPDGTNSAWLMQANPVNKGGVLGQLKVNGYITYAPFTVSFYVKKINHRYVGIKISLAGDLTSNERIPFVDLDAAPGAGTIPGTPSRPQAIRSVAVGGGWYRVSASYLIEPGTPTVDPDPVYAGWADLTFTTADGTTNYTSAGTEQLYVWHPQNEANWEPTEYQATEGAPVINTPRFDYHPTTHAFRGLMIEEQRKNLIPFSESAERHSLSGGGGITRVVDSAVAPSGAPIADAISGNDTNAFLDIQGLDLSPATVYTRSIFVKKTSGATVFPAISSQYWNSGYSNLQTSGVILNTNNGTAYANSGWGTPGSESRITVEDENSFWRVSFTSTSPLNTRYGYLRFYPAANTTGTDGTALATSSPTT